MDTPVLDVTADEAADLLRDPYPIFGRRRAETNGVFCGSVMDWTKTPEEFRPENLYAAVSFDAVNRIFRDSKVRVQRNNKTLHTGAVASLKREKDDAREVREGLECGIRLGGFNDLKEGDILEAYKVEEFARTF